MATLLAFTAPPGTTDFTGIAIFGNDFKASVAGSITGVWYFHTNSNEGPNAGVAVHRVSDQVLLASKSFSTATLTDNAWNLITLDSAVSYPTPNVAFCLSIHYPASMGFAFTDGLNDLTSGQLTVVRDTARFKNSGSPALGDFPTSNDTTVGFAVGIEFTASGQTVSGTALGDLGTVTATGVGKRIVKGTAPADLGTVLALASGKRIVKGIAASDLGGISATAVKDLERPGGWYQLISIERERREEYIRSHSAPPVACPNDGEPLRAVKNGSLRCPYDGWEWPRDRATAIQ